MCLYESGIISPSVASATVAPLDGLFELNGCVEREAQSLSVEGQPVGAEGGPTRFSGRRACIMRERLFVVRRAHPAPRTAARRLRDHQRPPCMSVPRHEGSAYNDDSRLAVLKCTRPGRATNVREVRVLPMAQGIGVRDNDRLADLSRALCINDRTEVMPEQMSGRDSASLLTSPAPLLIAPAANPP